MQSDLELFVLIAQLTFQLVTDRCLIFKLLLFLVQFNLDVAHLDTMTVNRNLHVAFTKQ